MASRFTFLLFLTSIFAASASAAASGSLKAAFPHSPSFIKKTQREKAVTSSSSTSCVFKIRGGASYGLITSENIFKLDIILNIIAGVQMFFFNDTLRKATYGTQIDPKTKKDLPFDPKLKAWLQFCGFYSLALAALEWSILEAGGPTNFQSKVLAAIYVAFLGFFVSEYSGGKFGGATKETLYQGIATTGLVAPFLIWTSFF